MNHESKSFDHLIGTPGFSDELLKNHFALYQGYVKNLQTVEEELLSLKQAGKTGTSSFAELRRRFGWEYNGVRLHEYYFGNLAKNPSTLTPDSALEKKIVECFGSHEALEKDLRAVGAIRGIGWAVLSYDAESRELINVWVNEHDMGHLAGAAPILVLDVFEHAYMLDYGIRRIDYLDAFFRAVDWPAAEERFHKALRP